MSTYRLMPLSIIKLAGVSFDRLEALASPACAELTRRAARAEDAVVERAQAALRVPLPEGGDARLRAHLRTRLGQALPLPEGHPRSPELDSYVAALETLAAARRKLADALNADLKSAARALAEFADGQLRDYLVFASDALSEKLDSIVESVRQRGAFRSKDRQRLETLALYLQRVCAKNETYSAFGPVGWARLDARSGEPALRIAPEDALRRLAHLEHWVFQTLATTMSNDPDVRAEIPPRLHSEGRVEGDCFVRDDTRVETPLDDEARALLARCDGRTPAKDLGRLELIEDLAARGVLIWAVEAIPWDVFRVAHLRDEVRGWRGPARDRWLPALETLVAAQDAFAKDTDARRRRAAMLTVRATIEGVGANVKPRTRSLMAGNNPIGESCFRECGFSMRADVADTFTRDAAPWIDFYRDTTGYVTSEVLKILRDMFASCPRRGGRVPMPAYVQHCADHKLEILRAGIPLAAYRAFQDVRNAFRERLAATRSLAEPELELTPEDCRVVRERFSYERFDEYTYPMADLRIASASPEALGRGEYDWVIHEVHPNVYPLSHCFYGGCPDPGVVEEAYKRTTRGKPLGLVTSSLDFAPLLTASNYLEAYGRHCKFIYSTQGQAPSEAYLGADRSRVAGRIRPEWEGLVFQSGWIEVYVDDATGDVRMRSMKTGEDLGSFARGWWTQQGNAPFQFPLGPHAPRLRMGRVVVQVRTWTVAAKELGPGTRSASPRAMTAIERLRRRRDLPRFIFIRPTMTALGRAEWALRDKDLRPIYIDLDSPTFCNLLHRWLRKYDELEVTEMYPRPDQLVWREADGRRSFELRSVIVPGD